MTIHIINHQDGTVTARDEGTGIEATADASIMPGTSEKVARRELAQKVRQHYWNKGVEGVQRGMVP